MARYTLDTSMQDDMLPLVKARRGENRMRFVNLALTTDGAPVDLTGTTVTFNGLTAGDTKVIINVTTDDATKGYITVVFPKNAFSAPGWYKEAYISISKPSADPASITTASFRIKVFDNVDLSAEDAENVITVLDSTLDKLVDDTKQTLDKAIVDMTGQFSATQDKINTINTQIGEINTTLTNTQTAINNLSLNMIKGTITDSIDSVYNAGWYAVKNASATGLGTGLNGMLLVAGNKADGGVAAGTFQVFIDNRNMIWYRHDGGTWEVIGNTNVIDASTIDVNSVVELARRQINVYGDRSIRTYYLGGKDFSDLPNGFNKMWAHLTLDAFSTDVFITVRNYDGGIATGSVSLHSNSLRPWQIFTQKRDFTNTTFAQTAKDMVTNQGEWKGNLNLPDSPYTSDTTGTIDVEAINSTRGTIKLYSISPYNPTYMAKVVGNTISEWIMISSGSFRPTGAWSIKDYIQSSLAKKVVSLNMNYNGNAPTDAPVGAGTAGLFTSETVDTVTYIKLKDNLANQWNGTLSGGALTWKKVTQS